VAADERKHVEAMIRDRRGWIVGRAIQVARGVLELLPACNQVRLRLGELRAHVVRELLVQQPVQPPGVPPYHLAAAKHFAHENRIRAYAVHSE
jgi:hypothetical protein